MSFSPCITCTTIVWGLGVSDFGCGEDGCGTRVGNPVGTVGVITMKMMINTSSTSISGTMLGSETGAPLLPPIAMPIVRTPYRTSSALARNAGGGGRSLRVFVYNFDTTARGWCLERVCDNLCYWRFW